MRSNSVKESTHVALSHVITESCSRARSAFRTPLVINLIGATAQPNGNLYATPRKTGRSPSVAASLGGDGDPRRAEVDENGGGLYFRSVERLLQVVELCP